MRAAAALPVHQVGIKKRISKQETLNREPALIRKSFLLDLPLVFEEGRCGPHLIIFSSGRDSLIPRLPTAPHLSYLGVLVFCLDSSLHRDMNTGQVEFLSTYSVVDPSTISMILLCP
jgi:hypothetical protein